MAKEETQEEKDEKARLHYDAATNSVLCEICNVRVGLGRGRTDNYHKTHKGTPTCLAQKAKAERKEKKQAALPAAKPNRSILSFVKTIPRRVSAVASSSKSQLPPAGIEISDNEIPSPGTNSALHHNVSATATPVPVRTAAHDRTPTIALVDSLRDLIDRLPETIPEGTQMDVLAKYAGDPQVFDYPGISGEEIWEAGLNQTLKDGLGWGDGQTDWDTVIRRGKWGVDGLVRLTEYFVGERGVPESLFEGKLTLLMREMKQRATTLPLARAPTPAQASTSTPTAIPVPAPISVLPHTHRPASPPSNVPVGVSSDVNRDQPIRSSPSRSAEVTGIEAESDLEIIGFKPAKRAPISVPTCTGYRLPVPKGHSPHTSYPFGMHGQHRLPWDYSVRGKEMYLRSHSCSNCGRNDGRPCHECLSLAINPVVRGICNRMGRELEEGTTYAYLGWNDLVSSLNKKNERNKFLRFKALNQTRTVLRQQESLSNFKRLTVAIANEDVPRVARVVHVALKKKRGVVAILEQVLAAARGVYSVKSFQEKDRLLGTLLWRLGGDRIGHIAHRALGLPSVSTLRDGSVRKPVAPSVGMPTIKVIAANTLAVLDGILDTLRERRDEIQHLVVMVDELATEKRLRFNARTNEILGLCRRHGHKVSQFFGSMDDVEEMLEALRKGEVHLASEATIASIGILCKDGRLYSSRPILISGDCKKETGIEHAQMLQTILDAVRSVASTTGLRVVSLASDGESRRGLALVQLTFKRLLSVNSPLYVHLSPLALFNVHVGDDDLTCDKDWKHVFKRLRNLLLRDRGVLINGFRITPAVTKAHMQETGQSTTHINSIFNPNDLQDVRLAFQLLRDIWSLPPLSASGSTNPGTAHGREALLVLGKLLHHLVYAYVCVDLSLSEQLEHLSAAAHLLFALFKTSGKDFIPTQLCIGIILMIKNVFFCVAKAKVDTPNAPFFIILLGTDRLEIQFGILRTVVGNDSNLDILQISERASGLIDIADILAQKPEWDQGPRRLNVPTLARLGSESTVPTAADHLSPKYLKGDYCVKNVILLTCWRRGRALAVSDYAPTLAILTAAEQDGTIDLLSPEGTLLVDAPLDGEVDESSEAFLMGPAAPSQSSQGTDTTEAQVDIEDELQEVADGLAGSTTELTVESQFELTVTVHGKDMPKAKALALAFRYEKKASSTDRLKRVQEIERYTATQIQQASDFDGNDESRLLLIHDPIATLARVQDHLWLVVGEVNGIRYDGRMIDRLGHQLLVEPAVKVSFQIVGLRLVSSDDGQGIVFDWRTYVTPSKTFEIPGKLIETLNPDLAKGTSRPYYLFKSAFLVATASLLAQRLSRADSKHLPKLVTSVDFPYREGLGKACFLAKLDEAGTGDDADGDTSASMCTTCTPSIELDLSKPQRVLEHMGAHILFDPTVERGDLPCGMCLRPSSLCQYFLLKGKGSKGNPRVDLERSAGCPRLVNFQWGKAAISETNAPCSNVPLFCPLCPKVVWRYNMRQHLLTLHSPEMAQQYWSLWEIAEDETDAMRHLWNNRRKVKAKRKKRKGEPTLVISEAHTSIENAMRQSEDEEKDSDTDDSGNGTGSEESNGEGDGDFDDYDLSNRSDGGTTPEEDRPLETWGLDDTGFAVYSPDGARPARDTTALMSEGIMDGDEREGAREHSGVVEDKEGYSAPSSPAIQTPINSADTIIAIAAAPPQVPNAASVEAAELGRGKRVSKRKDLGHLNVCDCGETVDLNDKSRPTVKCAQVGCETVNFHRACVRAPKNNTTWKCKSCTASAPRAKRAKRS